MAEIKSVNNRFLKTNVHSDLDTELQSKLEALVKQKIKRGSVSLRVKTELLNSSDECKLNESAIRAYWLQLSEIAGSSQPVNVESLLHLPGVIDNSIDDSMNQYVWPVAQQAVEEALQKLNQMRTLEGEVMQKDMLANADLISQGLKSIEQLAPRVIEGYSRRMTDRINKLLAEHDVSIEPTAIIKEVGVFAEKVDISEETVRLGSHIEQFKQIANGPQSDGKKLDFVVQEMLRETNTIGSKANDVEIANNVVSIKTAIERIREMVQNAE